MAALDSTAFEQWLSAELLEFNKDVDLDIFPSYIKGILESESGDEMKESLFEIVSQLQSEGDERIQIFCEKILVKWVDEENSKAKSEAELQKAYTEPNINLHDLISLKIKDSVLHHTHIPSIDKSTIVQNYGHVSSGEESTDEEEENVAGSGKKSHEDKLIFLDPPSINQQIAIFHCAHPSDSLSLHLHLFLLPIAPFHSLPHFNLFQLFHSAHSHASFNSLSKPYPSHHHHHHHHASIMSTVFSKNTNAQDVKDREKEMRERARKETETKKHKDKEDREKQKQKEKDRKEGEKKRTQKGEKRRG